MAISSSFDPKASPANGNTTTYRGPFVIMTVLFFMWGFITSINDILIPRFKEGFHLNYTQIMLINSAFFGAYFVGSLAYFLISATSGDPIAKIGYKNGVVIGLLLAAAGTGLMWPATLMHYYPLILGSLFVIGLGFAMLQIAANPYVTILGPERTASSRLNLSQAFNSVGTTVGPLIGAFLIFEYFAKPGANEVDSARPPYLVFCLVFFLLAIIFSITRLPHVGEGKIEPGAGALKYPHVILGILAIFMYVGGEVSIGSAIINFLGQPTVAHMSPMDASKYVSLFWGGMLIGRFMASIELSEMKRINKEIWLILIPAMCFLLFWSLLSWRGDHFDYAGGWSVIKDYLPMIALCWLLFHVGQGKTAKTLFIFSLTIVALLTLAILAGGKTPVVSIWCVVGVGLFTSIGWPNIFSLALDGMGIYKSQVSSLLVMAILGAAVLPPLQGKIADSLLNNNHPYGLQISFIVPLLAYAYVAFYGAIGHRIGRNRLPAAAQN